MRFVFVMLSIISLANSANAQSSDIAKARYDSGMSRCAQRYQVMIQQIEVREARLKSQGMTGGRPIVSRERAEQERRGCENNVERAYRR